MENIKEKIEDKIIDCINFGSSGRLIIFKPENSDKDLVVQKRGDYKNKTIYLKIFQKEFVDDKNIKQKIKPEANFYLVFVDFDIIKQDIKDNFLIVFPQDFKQIEMTKKDFGKFLVGKIEEEK